MFRLPLCLLSDILQVPPIDSESDQGLQPATLKGEIEFQNVKFRYPSREEVQVRLHINGTTKKPMLNTHRMYLFKILD